MTLRDIRWGQAKSLRKYENVEMMPQEHAELLFRIMDVQADTEFASVQQHRPWMDQAPTMEDRWLQAKVMEDEMRHGLQVCQVLRMFGERGSARVEELLSRKLGDHKLDSFNIPFHEWSDVLAFTCFVDRVGIYQLGMFQECSFGPLARAIPLMLHEEQLHIGFGYNGLKRMVQDDSYYGNKEMAQDALCKWFPRALDMFGHSKSRNSQLAVDAGLKRTTNEVAREQYVKDVRPLIDALGLWMPDPDAGRNIG